jgi:hypothetical protein
MRLIIPPKPAYYYSGFWANKYSTCTQHGAIVKFLEKLPSEQTLAIPYGDGLVEDKKGIFDYTNLYMGYPDHVTLGVLTARPANSITNPILCLPLDDETFEIGLQAVLQRDIGITLPKWQDRKPVAFWRGAADPSTVLRKQIVRKLNKVPGTDVMFVRTPWSGPKDWQGENWDDVQCLYDNKVSHDGRPISLSEFVQHKYILIIDGRVIASGLQWVFGSGAVPILVTHPDNDFWFKEYLVPFVNYVPANVDNIATLVEGLIKNDSLSETIATNAKELADRIFSPEFQREHLRKKLQVPQPGALLQHLTWVNTPSAINEHLAILRLLATQCSHVIDLNAGSLESSVAFLVGLDESVLDKAPILWISHMGHLDSLKLQNAQETTKVQVQVTAGNSLEVQPLPESTDLTFIDTFHCYGQLRRELQRFAPITKKVIVMHDTSIDGIGGECERTGANANDEMQRTGFSQRDIQIGLWPAIVEFLKTHPDWRLVHRYVHNNGLTILAKTDIVEDIRALLIQACTCSCPCHHH